MFRTLLCVGLVLSTAACGGGGAPADDLMGTEWQVERSTEGAVTTVHNLAGSKWGGKGVLVEELSIGVLEGADEYMLGRVSAVAIDQDHVYVMDSQPAQLKVYRRDTGEFVRLIGKEGEGPGEYQFPFMMRVVGDEIFVQDGANGRISVFGVDGEYRHLLRLGSEFFGSGFVVAPDGRAYVAEMLFLDDSGEPLPNEERREGFVEVSSDGPVGETFYAPAVGRKLPDTFMMDESQRIGVGIPFMPSTVSGLATAPALVRGVNDSYAFEIYFNDGRTVLVDRYWQPVPVEDAEREHHRTRILSRMRTRSPDWTWTGAPIPSTKPAYASIIPDHGSRILIVRNLPSERGEDCVEGPSPEQLQERVTECWATRYAWDFFDFDGNYLGEVVRPDVQILGLPYMRDDTFVIPVDDEDGAVRVKVYRLRLPEDTSDS